MEEYRPVGQLSVDRAIRDLQIDAKAPGSSPRSRWLINLNDADLSQIDSRGLARFASHITAAYNASECGRCKIGVVAADDLAYGLTHIVRGYTNPRGGEMTIHITRREDQARLWLGSG